MLIYDMSLFQFAVPVLVVVLCVFLVFAFGFKSPGTPPTLLDLHDDEEKIQKAKKSGGRKSGKSSDASNSNSSVGKQPFVAPAPKQVNNFHVGMKVPLLPHVEKAQDKAQVIDHSKPPKAKKPAKKVDENANIVVIAEEGDWMTAVSKKNRKNLNKKKEVSSETVMDLKITKEEAVEPKEVSEKAKEVKEVNIEPEEKKGEVTPPSPVVPTKVEASVDTPELDSNEEVADEVRKKKQKKKNKKANKVGESAEQEVQIEAVVQVEEAMVDAIEVGEAVVDVPPAVDEVVEAANEKDVEENKEFEVVKTSKKKKTPESRKKFQEVPPVALETEVKNEDEFMVQVHQPVIAAPSPKKNKSQIKREETKCKDAPVVSPEPVLPSPDAAVTSSNPVMTLATDSRQDLKDSSLVDQGDWKQAKSSKRKRHVQKEH